MVGSEVLKKTEAAPRPVSSADLPEEELRWTTVSLREVMERNLRLEASVFDIEGKHAREVLKRCKWPCIPLCGSSGISSEAFYPGRFKRVYCEAGAPDVIGFLGSSEMLDVRPRPVKFLSPAQNDIDRLRVEKGWILLSRSGTIGNVSLVGSTLSSLLISEHAIRIIVEQYPGYVYAFLKTSTGQAIIKASIYGAVVDQIEPAHLENVPVPNPPPILKERIHDLVMKSYELRDESNQLLAQAERLLYDVLKLPPIEKLKPHYFDRSVDLRNYTVKLSQLGGRLDASYHVPIVDAILRELEKNAAEVTTIGDPRISKRIILPGRFARIYVQEGQGVPFFGGKQIFELDPSNKKYLSLVHHKKRIKEQLALQENMILVTCSGTIGKVNIVPKHWEGWTANQHIIRVVPASEDIAGYLYVFLASDYGYELITKFTYGAVVDEIDDKHVSQVAVPLLKDVTVQSEINRLALEANEKRYEAYRAEQEAVRITNEEVIHAT